MKHALLIAIALIVPTFFLLLALSSAYHRRKARQKQSAEAPGAKRAKSGE